MPIFLPVISFGLPAGLVLYFAVSNLYRVGQQWFISRSIYGPHKAAMEALPASSTGPDAATTQPTGFLASLKQAAGMSSDGGNGSSSTTSAKSTKAPAKRSAATKTPAKKAPARATPKAAPAKAESGRAQPSNRASSAPPKSDNGTKTPGGAALQPRARKNKKG